MKIKLNAREYYMIGINIGEQTCYLSEDELKLNQNTTIKIKEFKYKNNKNLLTSDNKKINIKNIENAISSYYNGNGSGGMSKLNVFKCYIVSSLRQENRHLISQKQESGLNVNDLYSIYDRNHIFKFDFINSLGNGIDRSGL